MVPQYPISLCCAPLASGRVCWSCVSATDCSPNGLSRTCRRAQCPFEVNVAGHIAAIETLRNLDFVLGNVARIIEERERLYRVMSCQSYLEPLRSQGNFILAHVCEDEVQMKQIRATVEAHGICCVLPPSLPAKFLARHRRHARTYRRAGRGSGLRYFLRTWEADERQALICIPSRYHTTVPVPCVPSVPGSLRPHRLSEEIPGEPVQVSLRLVCHRI